MATGVKTHSNELKRVRGLGSAQEGAHHWMLQRITALSNLTLIAWLVFSLFRLPAYDHELMVEWLAQPLVAVPAILILVSIFWHLRLGLQVLIEDYVDAGPLRVAALVALNFYAVAGPALGIFAVARVAFAGGAA